jgi:hypothetical protein
MTTDDGTAYLPRHRARAIAVGLDLALFGLSEARFLAGDGTFADFEEVNAETPYEDDVYDVRYDHAPVPVHVRAQTLALEWLIKWGVDEGE